MILTNSLTLNLSFNLPCLFSLKPILNFSQFKLLTFFNSKSIISLSNQDSIFNVNNSSERTNPRNLQAISNLADQS